MKTSYHVQIRLVGGFCDMGTCMDDVDSLQGIRDFVNSVKTQAGDIVNIYKQVGASCETTPSKVIVI